MITVCERIDPYAPGGIFFGMLRKGTTYFSKILVDRLICKGLHKEIVQFDEKTFGMAQGKVVQGRLCLFFNIAEFF